jgi:hypothetical protein
MRVPVFRFVASIGAHILASERDGAMAEELGSRPRRRAGPSGSPPPTQVMDAHFRHTGLHEDAVLKHAQGTALSSGAPVGDVKTSPTFYPSSRTRPIRERAAWRMRVQEWARGTVRLRWQGNATPVGRTGCRLMRPCEQASAEHCAQQRQTVRL